MTKSIGDRRVVCPNPLTTKNSRFLKECLDEQCPPEMPAEPHGGINYLALFARLSVRYVCLAGLADADLLWKGGQNVQRLYCRLALLGMSLVL
jgi:hypothetical protein